MTTTFFLVRHGTHPLLGRVLAGRMKGVSLDEAGRVAAGRVGRRLAAERLTVLQSSPLERTRETAEPISQEVGLPIEVAEPLVEIEFGEWTGKGFDELERDPLWRIWNTARSSASAPGGESMADAQARCVRHIRELCEVHPDGRVALVSHAEVIRGMLLYFLGMSLDFWSRIEVSPASVSTLIVGDWGAKVHALNEAAPA